MWESGNNTNQDDKGNTPLFWAYSVKNNKVVDVLIKAGADPKIKNNDDAFYNDVKSLKQRVYLDQQGNIELETYE